MNSLLNVHENCQEVGDEIHTAELHMGKPTELLKCSGTELTFTNYKFVCAIWKNETIPKNWKKSIIIPIFKKGDKAGHNNCRGISSYVKRNTNQTYSICGGYNRGLSVWIPA